MIQTSDEYHYIQVGDDGPITPMASPGDVRAVVKSCPLALSMIDKSNHQVRKAIRKDRYYLNRVFEIYNNNCQAPAGDPIRAEH
jgi:hypothetical protein